MRRRAMRRALPAIVALACMPSCLQIETFFFAGESIDGYRWDEAAPELDGDLTDAHPSLVPASDRIEGFATLADGRAVHWVFAHRPGATTTILYSHGNGPHLGRFWDRVERLWELGYHVLIYDYPGFGRSDGDASEQGLYDAVDAVWEQAFTDLPDADRSDVILYGQSLGGGATMHLASRTLRHAVRPRAVITEAIWCSIEAQIQDGAFLDLPRELLAHLEIDNCARMSELDATMPVLVMHGARDRVATVRQARLLEAAASFAITLRIVDPAGHTDVVPLAGEEYAAWITQLDAASR